MFSNYFRTAWRNLQRNKVYAFINIAGLSLGLACAMLIMLYVKDETSYDRFHKNAGLLYRIAIKSIKADGSVEISGHSGYFQGPRFTAGIPEIKSFVRYQQNRRDIKTGHDIQSQEVFYTDTSFFNVFFFPLLSGDPATALKEPGAVVISEGLAKKQFGTTDALGKTILIKDKDGFEPHIVTGVSKKCPQNSSIKFDMLMPVRVSKEYEADKANWFNFSMNSFVVLSPGSNTGLVEAKMKQVYETDAGESIKRVAEKYNVKSKTVYFLQPFLAMHLSKEPVAGNGLVDGSNPVYAYILSGIAVFILLIACINFVNLNVARSVKRAKEIGIRKVIGADRKQLIMQFLGESFILCLAACTLALGLVELILPLFNTLSNKALALSYLFDAKLAAGYILLFIITSLLAGFYPALVLSGYNPVQTLYNRIVPGGKNYLQQSLVVFQFALASFLIIATTVIYFQFNFLTTQKRGYEDSNLIAIEKWGMKPMDAKLFAAELMKSADIKGVAAKNGGSWGTGAKINGEQPINFEYVTIDASYLPLLKIPVVQGRNFSADFPSDSTTSILVNESFVREAGWKYAIGQQVNFIYQNNEKYSVVGVVKDYHYEALTSKIGPQVFMMKPANGFGMVCVKIRPGSETAVLPFIEKAFKKQFPVSPYSYKFQSQENLASYEAESKWKQVMLFSAILTIFISCIGLFGLSVLAAERRIKEIGIRKVLGASLHGVVAILSADFLKLVIISLMVAIPLSWIAAIKWLENYPYRVKLNWWMFAGAGMLVVLIALVTVSFQAISAAIANPVKSLRYQ